VDSHRHKRELLAVVVAVLLVKLALLLPFWHYIYYDVAKAILAGAHYAHAPETFSINNKTWLGPLLWYELHAVLGIAGLKLLNLGLFVLLCWVQVKLSARAVARPAAPLALLIFGLYVGTNLNVVAGEPDDVMAALLFSLGVLLSLQRRNAFLAALPMGLGILFKFSSCVFLAGFFLALLVHRRELKSLLLTGLGALLPLAAISLLDRGLSIGILWRSVGMQVGFSSWGEVGFKLLSTGLLPLAGLALWAWWRRRDELHAQLVFPVAAYLVYVLLMRDAYAASYVMMLGTLLVGPPVAALVFELLPGMRARTRRALLIAGAALYCLATTAVSLHNLSKDTEDVRHRFNAAAFDRVRDRQSPAGVSSLPAPPEAAP